MYLRIEIDNGYTLYLKMATAEESDHYDEEGYCRDEDDGSPLKKNSLLVYRIFCLEKDHDFSSSGVNSLAFSPDGKTICAGLDDSTMRLIKFETREHFMVENNKNFTNVIYSPRIWAGKRDKIYSIVTDDPRIKCYDVKDNVLDDATHEENPQKSYLSMALSTNGLTLCLGGKNGSLILRKTSLFYPHFENFEDHASTEDEKRRHDGPVNSITFSPDPESMYICSGSDDKTVKLWSWSSELILNLINTFSGHTNSVTSVKFWPRNQNYFCSGSKDKTVRVWNTITGQQVRQYEHYNGNEGEVHCVTFSPDGTLVCSARGAFVDLWEIKTNRLMHIFKGHTMMVSSVAFSPNGEFICSGSDDRNIVVWTNPSWQVSLLNEPRMIKWHQNPGKLSPESKQIYFTPEPKETDNNINIIMYFIWKGIGKNFPENISSIIREQGQFTIRDVQNLRVAAHKMMTMTGTLVVLPPNSSTSTSNTPSTAPHSTTVTIPTPDHPPPPGPPNYAGTLRLFFLVLFFFFSG
jgi:WD40 repeat protein